MQINPDLYQEVTQLADLLRAKFSPTEFIPGCLVKSVADKSQYATNNGWIEAVCGQHNQQRVRWKSNETVAVNDFVDVLYFPDRRLFEAYGLGGAGAIAGAAGGNAWPLAGQNLLEGVNYATATLLIAAMTGGDIGHLGARSSSEAVTANESGITLRGVGASATIFTTTFTVTDPATLQDIKATHTGAANTIGFNISDSTTLIDCIGIADSTGTTARGLNVTGSAQVTVKSGYYEGQNGTAFDIFADAGTTIILDGPVLFTGLLGGSGDITGWYLDTLGAAYFVHRTAGTTEEIVFNNGNLAFGSGTTLDLVNGINEISIDGTLAGNSDLAVPTEKAVKSYVDGLSSSTSNIIINGIPLIWQRGTSFAAVATSSYIADRWRYDFVGAVAHTITQDATVPTVAQAGLLIPYSIKLDVTTVDASIAAGDFCTLQTRIEGYNFLAIAQRQFTLSFWVRDTKTGIHCVSFSNSGFDRSYVAEYTISVADTWEYKTITVSASPTAGTWDYTTGMGLAIRFALSCGSTFQTTADAWQTGNFIGTANQVNATDNTANNFYLAMVKVEPGAVATPFILPDYGQEKSRCLRYCWVPDVSSQVANTFVGAKFNTTLVIANRPWPVPMRIAPVLTHNVTGYTAGAPTTTTVALQDFGVGNFATITGALTLAIGAANTEVAALSLTAGTSWSGTAGNQFALRLGPTVMLIFNSDF